MKRTNSALIAELAALLDTARPSDGGGAGRGCWPDPTSTQRRRGCWPAPADLPRGEPSPSETIRRIVRGRLT
jgi:hypothetical protein